MDEHCIYFEYTRYNHISKKYTKKISDCINLKMSIRLEKEPALEFNNESFNIPVSKTSHGQRSFKYNANKLFNSLASDIRNITLHMYCINKLIT